MSSPEETGGESGDFIENNLFPKEIRNVVLSDFEA